MGIIPGLKWENVTTKERNLLDHVVKQNCSHYCNYSALSDHFLHIQLYFSLVDIRIWYTMELLPHMLFPFLRKWFLIDFADEKSRRRRFIKDE